MEITEVKVFPVSEEKLRAFVSVVFDQCFMVNDIKVIHGRDGLFISMPSRRKKNGEFKDVAHPLNNETRRILEERVLTEYERVLAERGEAPVGFGDLKRPAASSLGEQAESGQPSPEAATGKDPEAAREKTEKDLSETPEARTLEEVEELHLRDSFWSVP